MNDFATIHRQAFYEEALELLSSFELTLMELEKHPKNKDLLNRAFRNIHTIKGSSAMVGFIEISEFVHALEDLLDKIRNDEILIDEHIIDLALSTGDHVRNMLEHYMHDAPLDQATGQALMDRVVKCNPAGLADQQAAPAAASPPPPAAPPVMATRAKAAKVAKKAKKSTAATQAAQTIISLKDESPNHAPQPAKIAGQEKSTPLLTPSDSGGPGHSPIIPADIIHFFQIQFMPSPGILHQGTDPLLLLDELKSLGRTQLLADFSQVPDLADLDPSKCQVNWEIWLVTNQPMEKVQEIFMFIEDDCQLDIREIPVNFRGGEVTPTPLGQAGASPTGPLGKGATGRFAPIYPPKSAPQGVLSTHNQTGGIPNSFFQNMQPLPIPLPSDAEQEKDPLASNPPSGASREGTPARASRAPGFAGQEPGGMSPNDELQKTIEQSLEAIRQHSRILANGKLDPGEVFDRLEAYIGDLVTMQAQINQSTVSYLRRAWDWNQLREKTGS